MTHMTNTRIKDTLYEDAHLDERGMQDRGGGGEAKAVWQPLLRTWHISLFLFFACAPSKPEADDNCSAYPLPV